MNEIFIVSFLQNALIFFIIKLYFNSKDRMNCLHFNPFLIHMHVFIMCYLTKYS